jgi:hypothetical protein
MNKILRIILVATVIVPNVAFAGLVSSDLGDFLLGVDKSKQLISGYVEMRTGNNFSCIFYLRGDLKGKPPYKIKTWFPKDRNPKEVIEGIISDVRTDEGKPSVLVKLKEEHGGCWNVWHFAEDSQPIQIYSVGAWKEIRVVSSNRAYFHDEPRKAKKRKAYLVIGDSVRVYSEQQGWIQAEYVSESGKKTSGWIKESDLFSAIPPGD